MAHSPLLTFPSSSDSAGRRIVVLHGSILFSASPAPTASEVEGLVSQNLRGHLGHITLLYIHDANAIISRAGCRACSSVYSLLSEQLRRRIQRIIVLHATLRLRGAFYAYSGAAYPILRYCDLVEDVERELEVDSLLLNLPLATIRHDEVNREWVGRKPTTQIQPLDPRNPLISLDCIDLTRPSSSVPTPGDAELEQADSSGV